MKIEILGPGCYRCIETEANVRKALEELGLTAEVIKVEDIKKFRDYGIMFTPAVFIDGQKKVSGKIPSVAEIKSWLSPYKEGKN